MEVELGPAPVADVNRAKTCYTEVVGFNADHDHQVSEIEVMRWGSLGYFSDLVGNSWLLKQAPPLS
jgi:hypothetical protein